MKVKFDDIDFAFSIASAGGVGENEAYIDRSSGKVYWYFMKQLQMTMLCANGVLIIKLKLKINNSQQAKHIIQN